MLLRQLLHVTVDPNPYDSVRAAAQEDIERVGDVGRVEELEDEASVADA